VAAHYSALVYCADGLYKIGSNFPITSLKIQTSAHMIFFNDATICYENAFIVSKCSHKQNRCITIML